jgi:hypothetical protein
VRRAAAAAQVRVVVTAASHEEYDHALAAAPELCRPFAAAMGDRRTAAQCLADYDIDRAAGLAGLGATDGGRRAAERLAVAVAARFATAAAGGRQPVLLENGSLV